MKNQFKLFLTATLLLIAQALSVQSQPKGLVYPEVGKPLPDVTFNEIHYFSKSQASVQDFKGKWLILDFWTRWCGACIASFPETNQLSKEFADKVQFMLVGIPDNSARLSDEVNKKTDEKIRPLYEKFRKKYNLELPVAYDSTLARRFGIRSYPHIIWIDEKGIVRAITSKIELTAENITAFVSGKNPTLMPKEDLMGNPYQLPKVDIMKPLLVDGNGGESTDFIYRSLLTRWKYGMPFNYDSYFVSIKEATNARACFIGVTLSNLYTVAYSDTISTVPLLNFRNSYGKYWITPLLKLSDTSEFSYNYKTGKNVFNYELIVPRDKSKRSLMQQMMQRDLQNYFGYKVTVETRIMPYWKITTLPGAGEKLRARGTQRYWGGDGHSTTVLKAMPMETVINLLWSKYQNAPPFVDETGITYKIDLTLNAILNDLNDVKKELQKNGLVLEKSEKEMKVIVIRDKQSF